MDTPVKCWLKAVCRLNAARSSNGARAKTFPGIITLFFSERNCVADRTVVIEPVLPSSSVLFFWQTVVDTLAALRTLRRHGQWQSMPSRNPHVAASGQQRQPNAFWNVLLDLITCRSMQSEK